MYLDRPPASSKGNASGVLEREPHVQGQLCNRRRRRTLGSAGTVRARPPRARCGRAPARARPGGPRPGDPRPPRPCAARAVSAPRSRQRSPPTGVVRTELRLPARARAPRTRAQAHRPIDDVLTSPVLLTWDVRTAGARAQPISDARAARAETPAGRSRERDVTASGDRGAEGTSRRARRECQLWRRNGPRRGAVHQGDHDIR